MTTSLAQTVLQTLQSEFSDAPDAEQVTRLLTRLLLAGVLGGVLGYERESRGKAAGVRTHADQIEVERTVFPAEIACPAMGRFDLVQLRKQLTRRATKREADHRVDKHLRRGRSCGVGLIHS